MEITENGNITNISFKTEDEAVKMAKKLMDKGVEVAFRNVFDDVILQVNSEEFKLATRR